MPGGWRKMWLMILYDLPVAEKDQRTAATKFHTFLGDEGFERLHYSVYLRFCGSVERLETFERRVQRGLPPCGSVYALRLTDRQMGAMKRWIHARPDVPVEQPAQYHLL